MLEVVSIAAKWMINYLEIPNYLYVRAHGLGGKGKGITKTDQKDLRSENRKICVATNKKCCIL